MPTNARCLAVLIATCLLTCAGGCQVPEFFRNRIAARSQPPVEDEPRLTKRQVADVQLTMARALEQQGDSARAFEVYQEAARNNLGTADANWRMAVLYDRQGKVGQSEALYRKALKVEPQNAEMHCDFGYSLYLQKRWGEAEEHLRQALAIDFALHRAHNNLGLLLAQTERLDEAHTEFRQAGCQESDARANLAFVLTLNNHWDEAQRQYEAALAADPGSTTARAGLESLQGLVAKTTSATGSLTPAAYEGPARGAPASEIPTGYQSAPRQGL